MSRNQFNLLRSVIHFVDNEMASEEVKKDRLWKLRPFLDSFRRQCLTIAPRQKQSIDKMMVPYKKREATSIGIQSVGVLLCHWPPARL